MTQVHYEVVEHDGGWADRLDGVYSEMFRTREDAHQAAEAAASEQVRPGETEAISYQDGEGRWHEELASGEDRPQADVVDTP